MYKRQEQSLENNITNIILVDASESLNGSRVNSGEIFLPGVSVPKVFDNKALTQVFYWGFQN